MTTEAELQEKSAKDLAREFLMGELMNAATKQLRALDKPWLRLPEAQQKKTLREVQDDIAAAVKQAVEVIASDDRTRFRALVESVTFKDGVKAVLTMNNTEASHELADTAGGTVLVVIEDPTRYTYAGENAPKADSDQAELAAS
jgi:hypothetical protein